MRPDRDADIGQDEDDERDDAFGSHSPAAAPSSASGFAFVGDRVLVARFGHEAEEDEKRYGRGGAKGKKRDAIAEMIDDDAGRQAR